MGYMDITNAMVDKLFNSLVTIVEGTNDTELVVDLQNEMDELDEQSETEEVKIRSLLKFMAKRF